MLQQRDREGVTGPAEAGLSPDTHSQIWGQAGLAGLLFGREAEQREAGEREGKARAEAGGREGPRRWVWKMKGKVGRGR